MNRVRSSRPGESPIPDDSARSVPGESDPNLPASESSPDRDSGRGNSPEPAEAAATSPAADDSDAEPDFKNRWLRAEAELQNYRRRARREVEESRREAEERVMLEMIGALDDLERALRAAREAGESASWVQGVELVANRLREYLARQGVSVVEPLGQRFDPEFHESLLEIDAPPGASPGAVVEVVVKGYRRGERVLRAARVVVARAGAGGDSGTRSES